MAAWGLEVDTVSGTFEMPDVKLQKARYLVDQPCFAWGCKRLRDTLNRHFQCPASGADSSYYAFAQFSSLGSFDEKWLHEEFFSVV